jgi:hypothetical protein
MSPVEWNLEADSPPVLVMYIGNWRIPVYENSLFKATWLQMRMFDKKEGRRWAARTLLDRPS